MKITFIFSLAICLCLTGCGKKDQSSKASPSPPNQPTSVKQPDPWDNPAEFSAWVDKRFRVLQGAPPSKPKRRSLNDIGQQPDKKKALAELQGRMEDAFKEVSAKDGAGKLTPVLTLLKIALKQAEMGGRAEAVNNIRKLLQQFDGIGNYTHSYGSKMSVYALVILGELKLAQEVAGKIGIQYMKRPALQFIAHVLIAEGKKEQAVGFLKQALEIARSIDDKNGGAMWEDRKISALCYLSKKFVEAGEKDTALAILKETRDFIHVMAGNEEANIDMDRVWRSIAKAQFALGKKEDALTSLKKALDVVHAIDGRNIKPHIFSSTALLYAEFGEKEMALNMFKQAAAMVANIQEPTDQAKSQYGIAEAMASIGALMEAMEKASAIEDVAGYNPSAGFGQLAYRRIADALVLERVPNKYKLNHDARPVPIMRLKKAFTPEEKHLAKKFVEALQVK